MPRVTAARVLALAALAVLLTLDVVLLPPVLPLVKSSLLHARPIPSSTAGPATTPTPATAPTPATGGPALGTYWTCSSNESDTGKVSSHASPPPNAVSSPLCDSTYGEQGPGQPQPRLPSKIKIWRIPVGTFSPFLDCGARVVNIVDPYDRQAAPQTWPPSHQLRYDAAWNQIRSGDC